MSTSQTNLQRNSRLIFVVYYDKEISIQASTDIFSLTLNFDVGVFFDNAAFMFYLDERSWWWYVYTRNGYHWVGGFG